MKQQALFPIPELLICQGEDIQQELVEPVEPVELRLQLMDQLAAQGVRVMDLVVEEEEVLVVILDLDKLYVVEAVAVVVVVQEVLEVEVEVEVILPQEQQVLQEFQVRVE